MNASRNRPTGSLRSVTSTPSRVILNVRWTRQMRRFRKPTIVETITLIAITAILAELIFTPDSATATRRQESKAQTLFAAFASCSVMA